MEVVGEHFEFVAQGDEFVAFAQREAEEVGEAPDEVGDPFGAVDVGHLGDGAEGVEEEVGVDARLEELEVCFAQGLFEFGGGHLFPGEGQAAVVEFFLPQGGDGHFGDAVGDGEGGFGGGVEAAFGFDGDGGGAGEEAR